MKLVLKSARELKSHKIGKCEVDLKDWIDPPSTKSVVKTISFGDGVKAIVDIVVKYQLFDGKKMVMGKLAGAQFRTIIGGQEFGLYRSDGRIEQDLDVTTAGDSNSTEDGGTDEGTEDLEDDVEKEKKGRQEERKASIYDRR